MGPHLSLYGLPRLNNPCLWMFLWIYGSTGCRCAPSWREQHQFHPQEYRMVMYRNKFTRGLFSESVPSSKNQSIDYTHTDCVFIHQYTTASMYEVSFFVCMRERSLAQQHSRSENWRSCGISSRDDRRSTPSLQFSSGRYYSSTNWCSNHNNASSVSLRSNWLFSIKLSMPAHGFATHFHSLVKRMFMKIFNSALSHLCNTVSLLLVSIECGAGGWLIIAGAQSTLWLKMDPLFYSTL